MGADLAAVHAALACKGWPSLLREIGFAPIDLRVPCPVHGGRGPNCALDKADGRLVFYCHSHGCTGSAIDFIGAVRGLAFPAALEVAAGLVSVTLDTKNPAHHDTEAEARARAAYTAAHTRAATEPERTYPDPAEVAALWSSCVPVTDHEPTATYLRGRALDPVTVADRDLARALPDAAPLPAWARCKGQRWTDGGYRLIVPYYDHQGATSTVRAGDVTGTADPKRASPSGHRAAGLVMADGTARLMLETGGAPSWWPSSAPFRLVVVEGEPDFLTWATQFSDAAECAPAVVGITSGAWTEAIAARVPDKAIVIVRTDHDTPGDKYAEQVRATLAGRCTLKRSTSK